MDGNQSSDSLLTANAIMPYKKQIDTEMSVVICQSAVQMNKAQPESTMGNWACDAIAQKTAEYTGKTVDFAILNYGGLRVLSLPQGNLTKGNIFEVMPFDNLMVAVEMKGATLQQLFDHLAAKDGWPVSAAVRMTITKGKKAANISINGKTIDPDKTYVVATIDYIANGGDNCTFFANKPRTETGKFLRDAVIEYCAAAKTIEPKIEGRVVLE